MNSGIPKYITVDTAVKNFETYPQIIIALEFNFSLYEGIKASERVLFLLIKGKVSHYVTAYFDRK